MNNRCSFLPLLASLALCTLLVSGCLAPTASTTLHTLQPIRQQPMGNDLVSMEGLLLVMPVTLAPHLQGRGLIRQPIPGEAWVSTTHFWVGPLDQQIGQQVVNGLRDLLATDNIALYPGPRFGTIRYQLEIELSEFSGNGDTFTTTAVYTVSDAVARTMVVRKTFRQSRPIDTPDLSGYVASASQAIADLSKEAATALLAVRRSPSSTTAPRP